MNLSKVKFKLRVEKSNLAAFENFCYKIATFFEYFDCDVKCGDE